MKYSYTVVRETVMVQYFQVPVMENSDGCIILFTGQVISVI